MLKFPARFEPDPAGGYVVTFRDIPEAITQADTLEEAREMARDALVTAMDFYFEDGRAVPAPTKSRRGEEVVALPPSIATKVDLLNQQLLSLRRQIAALNDALQASEKKDAESQTRIKDLGSRLNAALARQVQELQHAPRRDPDRLFAVGKYQIIPQTMDGAIAAMALRPSFLWLCTFTQA